MRTEKAIVRGPYIEKHGEKERFRLILQALLAESPMQ